MTDSLTNHEKHLSNGMDLCFNLKVRKGLLETTRIMVETACVILNFTTNDIFIVHNLYLGNRYRKIDLNFLLRSL